jgi:hypothetical protein
MPKDVARHMPFGTGRLAGSGARLAAEVSAMRASVGRRPLWAVVVGIAVLVGMVPSLVVKRMEGDPHQAYQRGLGGLVDYLAMWGLTGVVFLVGTVMVVVAIARSGPHPRLAMTGAGLIAGVALGFTIGAVVDATTLPAPTGEGTASVTVDGVPVGVSSVSPEIACYGRTDAEGPSLIASMPQGDGWGSWMIPGGDDEPESSLLLEFTPDRSPVARVEFAIGSTLYRSEDAGALLVGPMGASRTSSPSSPWAAGRVTFTDIPLVAGDPWRGHPTIALDVAWECWAQR